MHGLEWVILFTVLWFLILIGIHFFGRKCSWCDGKIVLRPEVAIGGGFNRIWRCERCDRKP